MITVIILKELKENIHLNYQGRRAESPILIAPMQSLDLSFYKFHCTDFLTRDMIRDIKSGRIIIS